MADDALTQKPADQPPQSRRAGLPFWLILAGMVGLAIFFIKDNEAFPSASLSLKLPRAEIVKLSQEWCRKLGYEPDGAITSTVFGWDNLAKTFLEFDLGTARANEVMRSEVPVWYWRSRFCRELQNQETQVYLGPSGQLIALRRKLENDYPAPSLTHEKAQALARDFVENEAAVSLSGYSLTNDADQSLAARTDHTFSWEKEMPDLDGAKMRIYVNVAGNAINEYHYHLYVPEAWQERFKTIRSYNALLGQIAGVFYMLLNFAVVLWFLRSVAVHSIRWPFALISGGVLAFGFALTGLNNIGALFDEYTTSLSLNQYFTQTAVNLFLASLKVFLMGTCFTASAESFYRKHYPDKLAIEHYFTFKGLSTPQASLGLWSGICGFGIAVGWVVAYYLGGEKIGFWCPLGITNYEVLSTVFPFYSAICLGVQAAFTEELLYRLIGLSLAQKLVRNFWLANLLQAAAWGFMHSNYPQQPAYARGLELTCSGLVFGWLMRRYGFLSCILAHYLLDAFLDSQTSLRSSVPSLQISALLPVVPVFLMAILSSLRAAKSQSAQECALNNSALPVSMPPSPRAAEPEGPALVYLPLSKRWRLALIVIICLALPAGAVLRAAPAVGDGFKLSIDRDEAIQMASEVMTRRGKSPSDYTHSAWAEDDISYVRTPLQYAFEKVGLKRVLELVNRTVSGFVWKVRFFRTGDRTEYQVDLDSHGKELSFNISEAEEAPGARIPEAKARKMAEAYIERVSPRLGAKEFENVAEDQEANRTDYRFTFRVPGLKVADADYKVATNVLGDEVSEVSENWDVPDEWKFEQSKTSRRIEIAKMIKTGSLVVIVLITFWWMIGVLRSDAVRWRSAALFALPVALLTVPTEINDLPTVLRFYSTNTPFTAFAFEQLLQLINSFATKFAEILLMTAFGAASCRILFPNLKLLGFWKTCIFPKKEFRATQRNLWLDAVLAAFTFVVLDWMIDCAAFAVQARCSPMVPIKPLSSVCLMANVYSPLVDNCISAVTRGIWEVLQVGILAGIYAKYFRAPWLFFVVLTVQTVIQNSDIRHWQDITADTVSGLLSGFLYWFFVTKLARKNILSYFLAGYAVLIFRKIPVLLSEAMPHFALDVLGEIVLLLLPVLFMLWLLFAPRSRPLNQSPIDLVE